MRDSFVRLHLSPKIDKKFTNESIRQSPLKVTGQRSVGDFIKQRQYAGLIQCPHSFHVHRQEMRFEWQLYLASQRLLKILWNGATHMQKRTEFDLILWKMWVTLIRYQLIKGMKYKLAAGFICMKLTLCLQ